MTNVDEIRKEYEGIKGAHRIEREVGTTYEDISGQRYGRLIAIKPVGRNEKGRLLWLFKCDCGNFFIQIPSAVRKRNNASCGSEKDLKARIEDLTGRKFGEWTVIKDEGGPKCLCRCSCGAEKTIPKSNLKRHVSTSCGCQRRKLLREHLMDDLTGRVFGRGTVIEFAGYNKSKQILWKLQCSCGNTYITSANNLRNNHCRSCGCIKREQTIERCTKPMIGKKFGRLTVIRKVDPPKKGRGHYYECECECKNHVVVQGSMLRSGNSRSCGCLGREKLIESRQKIFPGMRFGKLVVIEKEKTKPGKDSRYLCACDCGGRVSVIGYSLTTLETISCGCVHSKGEYFIAQILSNNNIPFVKQKSFSDLRSGKYGILRFDFYIEGKNYLIEFDGPQHDKPGSGWSTEENFKKLKHNDNLKNKYCKKNKIPLIRIPYSKVNNIELEDLLLESSKFII